MLLIGVAFLAIAFNACIRRNTASIPVLALNLYTGIDQLVRLDDTPEQIAARSTLVAKRLDILPKSELGQLKFTHAYHFEDVGVRAYIKHNRVALIEVQDPFKGQLVNRKVQLFPFTRIQDKTWEETLEKELGTPLDKSQGGRLSSELLVYSWGDISYNGLGPNEIAIYRDEEVSSYRKRNFGRVIKFWN